MLLLEHEPPDEAAAQFQQSLSGCRIAAPRSKGSKRATAHADDAQRERRCSP